MLVIYNRRRVQTDKKDIECDVRENIIKYNDDGGGADDLTAMTLTISATGDVSCHTLAEDTGNINIMEYNEDRGGTTS